MYNILVVDDSAVVRKMVARMLQDEDFNIIEASDGIEALEKWATEEIHLMIVDLNMPRMDGIELTKAIREKDADIPIIMLTTQPNEAERAYRAGANLYLVKPVPGHLLKFKVKSLLMK